MARRAAKRSALKTLRVYKALRRKGYESAKARAIAKAGQTPTARSRMVRKGNRTRRLR